MACALAQSVLQIDRPVVFLEEIADRLVAPLLKCFHLTPREQVERLPSLFIELHALAGHDQAVLLSSGRCRRGFGLSLSG